MYINNVADPRGKSEARSMIQMLKTWGGPNTEASRRERYTSDQGKRYAPYFSDKEMNQKKLYNNYMETWIKTGKDVDQQGGKRKTRKARKHMKKRKQTRGKRRY